METIYKRELVSNLRGFYLSSIIFSLSKNSFFKKFLTDRKIKKNSKRLKNEKINNLVNYLLDIDYLEEKKKYYQFTELGYDIFSRYYTFLVPCSYSDYLLNLDKFFFKNYNPKVDRLQNIIGSGITHKRYFYNSISYLRKKNKILNIVDLGCGNGFFLKTADNMLNINKIAGIDLASVSTKQTKKLFKGRKNTKFLTYDAGSIDKWTKKLKNFIKKYDENTYFFMWFIIHEISEKSIQKIVFFLKKIKKNYPKAKLVICELIKNNFKGHKKSSETSLMPEYQLFHNLSGQGIMSLNDYYKIFKSSKLKLENKIFFDNINFKGKNAPSAAIFFLK